MDPEESEVRYSPAENLDFTEADWLEEATREKYGGEPRRADERTVRDLMRLRHIGREAARNWLEAEVAAGRLVRRDVLIDGKITAVFRPAD